MRVWVYVQASPSRKAAGRCRWRLRGAGRPGGPFAASGRAPAAQSREFANRAASFSLADSPLSELWGPCTLPPDLPDGLPSFSGRWGRGWCPPKGRGVRGQVHMGLTGPDRECRPPHSRRGSPDGLPESSLQLVCSPPPHASPAHASPAHAPCSPRRCPRPPRPPRRRADPPDAAVRTFPGSSGPPHVRVRSLFTPVSLCWVRGPSVLVREGTSASRRLALRRVPEAPDPGSAVGLWRFPLRKTSPFPRRDVHLPFVHGSRALCAWTLRLIKPVPTSRCPASPFVEPLFLALTSAGSWAGPRLGPPVPAHRVGPVLPPTGRARSVSASGWPPDARPIHFSARLFTPQGQAAAPLSSGARFVCAGARAVPCR